MRTRYCSPRASLACGVDAVLGHLRLQTQEYRDSVLPPKVKARVAVEQASTFGWERYVGTSGRVIGMKTFGPGTPQGAPEEFGFEPDGCGGG